MKKVYFLVATLVVFATSCKKDIQEPVVIPADNSWIVNEKVFGPATFKYYDTARTIYGGNMRKASATVRFFKTPVESGRFAFRQMANELNEISIVLVDSTDTSFYVSQNDDGRALKGEQFADVKVTNGKITSVSFTDLFLKRPGSEEWAKVSLVIKP